MNSVFREPASRNGSQVHSVTSIGHYLCCLNTPTCWCHTWDSHIVTTGYNQVVKDLCINILLYFSSEQRIPNSFFSFSEEQDNLIWVTYDKTVRMGVTLSKIQLCWLVWKSSNSIKTIKQFVDLNVMLCKHEYILNSVWTSSLRTMGKYVSVGFIVDLLPGNAISWMVCFIKLTNNSSVVSGSVLFPSLLNTTTYFNYIHFI